MYVGRYICMYVCTCDATALADCLLLSCCFFLVGGMLPDDDDDDDDDDFGP